MARAQAPGQCRSRSAALTDAGERERLGRILDRTLDAAVGYVLPLAKTAEGAPWQSGPWLLRSERCHLIPGDSPMGFRLPLDSLPWVRPTDFPHMHPPDPNQSFEALAKPAPDESSRERDGRRTDAAIARAAATGTAATATGFAAGGSAAIGVASAAGAVQAAVPAPAATVRTSMCAEAREGVLYVFMPPTRCLEDYLELVAAVEASAAALASARDHRGLRAAARPASDQFQGHARSGRHRGQRAAGAGWDELAARTLHLYEDAAACKLRTEKFMIDGRHAGTGGGNHIVLGGATPAGHAVPAAPGSAAKPGRLLAQSSLALLPVLGPVHRPDQPGAARRRGAQRLALRAGDRVQPDPRAGRAVPPWLVDRLLRNLLIDVTGNTHRAEFCIDKLYSPGLEQRAGSGWSRCGPSRCRRMRA